MCSGSEAFRRDEYVRIVIEEEERVNVVTLLTKLFVLQVVFGNDISIVANLHLASFFCFVFLLRRLLCNSHAGHATSTHTLIISIPPALCESGSLASHPTPKCTWS